MTETELTELEIDLDELLVLALDNTEDRKYQFPYLNVDTGEIVFLHSGPMPNLPLVEIPSVNPDLEKEIINDFICTVKDNGLRGELIATKGLTAFLQTYQDAGGRLLTFNIFKESYITTKTLEWLRDKRHLSPIHRHLR